MQIPLQIKAWNMFIKLVLQNEKNWSAETKSSVF